MRKQEFLKMMVQDNETRTDKKALYSEVIDCFEIALSQSPENIEIDSSKNVEEAFKLINEESCKSPDHCCGPFRAAELIAEYLGIKYCRATKKFATNAIVPDIKSEDLFD